MNEERLSQLHTAYAMTHSADIRDELVMHYLPLSRAVAVKFVGRGVEREDLEQVAAMAMLQALERFDPAMGYKFSTFAVPTLTGALRNHIRDRGDGMKIPRDLRRQLYQMSQIQQRFERELGRSPSAVELAEEMSLTPDQLLMILDAAHRQNTVSLDSTVGEDGESTLESFLGRSDAGYEQVERSEMTAWLLSKLNPQERELISLRYEHQLGQRETAIRLGVSQMQVSRLERRVLSRLQMLAQAEMV